MCVCVCVLHPTFEIRALFLVLYRVVQKRNWLLVMVSQKQEVTKYRPCLGSQAGLDSGNLMSRDETKIQEEKLTWFLYICDLQKIPGKNGMGI